MRLTRITVYLLLVICFFGLAQCGDKNAKSKDIKFTLIPDDPIVINADLVLFPGQDNEQKITAPWFIFSSRVVNNSDSALNLVTYLFRISFVRNGQVGETTTTIDPSITCDEDGFSRSALAFIPAGATFTGLNPSPALPDYCDQTDIVSTSAEQWYIDSLPQADSFFYTVQVEGAGWFVDSSGVAIERLVMSGQMYTQ